MSFRIKSRPVARGRDPRGTRRRGFLSTLRADVPGASDAQGGQREHAREEKDPPRGLEERGDLPEDDPRPRGGEDRLGGLQDRAGGRPHEPESVRHQEIPRRPRGEEQTQPGEVGPRGDAAHEERGEGEEEGPAEEEGEVDGGDALAAPAHLADEDRGAPADERGEEGERLPPPRIPEPRLHRQDDPPDRHEGEDPFERRRPLDAPQRREERDPDRGGEEEDGRAPQGNEVHGKEEEPRHRRAADSTPEEQPPVFRSEPDSPPRGREEEDPRRDRAPEEGQLDRGNGAPEPPCGDPRQG